MASRALLDCANQGAAARNSIFASRGSQAKNFINTLVIYAPPLSALDMRFF